MTLQAKGPFDVKLAAQTADDATGGDAIGRMALDKRFHGDLDATSKGQMLAHRTGVAGSAGYVAMEIVSGTLQGRVGTFVLQHSGTMNRGSAHLALAVVPDSGTGEFEGLDGTMAIIIEAGGKHFYAFDYSLPEIPPVEPNSSGKNSARSAIDPETYQRALEEIRGRERQQGARFPGGKPFPIPDQDFEP